MIEHYCDACGQKIKKITEVNEVRVNCKISDNGWIWTEVCPKCVAKIKKIKK